MVQEGSLKLHHALLTSLDSQLLQLHLQLTPIHFLLGATEAVLRGQQTPFLFL